MNDTNYKWHYGYIILPCFKIRVFDDGTRLMNGSFEEAELICNWFLVMLFAYVFSWFWNGNCWLYEEDENDGQCNVKSVMKYNKDNMEKIK